MPERIDDMWFPWLPEGAIMACLSTIDLPSTVEEWSTHWFGLGTSGKPGACRTQGVPGNALALWTTDKAAGLWLGDKARANLRNLMFGQMPLGNELTASDCDALDQAIDKCIGDLCERLLAAFNLPKGQVWSNQLAPEMHYTWALGGDFTIALSQDAAVRLTKDRLPATTPGKPLRKLQDAWHPTEVVAGASIGRCRLTLGEITTLMVGDVLPLDRPVAAGAELIIDGALNTGTHCQVSPTQDKLILNFL